MAAPSEPLTGEMFVGRRVIKDFLDESTGRMAPFYGTVTRYAAGARWFRVTYDDGDSEDVEMGEVQAMVRRAAAVAGPAARPAPGSQQPKAKPKARPAPKLAAPKPAKRKPEAVGSGDPAPPAAPTPAAPAPLPPPPAGPSSAPAPAARTTSAAKLPPGAPILGLPEVLPRTRYDWPRSGEPWRALPVFNIPVSEEPLLDAAARSAAQDCKRAYYKRYRQAQADEEERLARDGMFTEGGKRRCMRPDRVTESSMKRPGGGAINREKRCGHVPGVAVSQRFYSRAELGCLGLHHPPIMGIEFVGEKDRAGPDVPLFAVSIVVGGWYEDNGDDGAELVYTGFGGNDLLGSRKQVADQKLEGANAALVGNIQLGLPVRVTRKNEDPHGLYGCVLIYDGLYNVVEYWREVGKEGFGIFRYRMLRRPGQGALLSATVRFGGISAPRRLTALARSGIVDPDISAGQEALPVCAVSEVEDGELPPCTPLGRVPAEATLKGVHRGISDAQLEALRRRGWAPTVEYVTEYKYMPGVTPPAPPVLPAKYRGDPHAYVRHLNHNRLPYLEARGGKLLQLREALPVVYECGPWAGCALGAACPQAASQRPLAFRLEVFATGDGRGWGVRSLDMIPQHAFICAYFGEVHAAGAFDALVERGGHDGAYSMDMALRPDRDWEGNWVEGAPGSVETAEFVVCGLRRRNVAAFFNHSCAPNCFVQPVLADHHDARLPKICIFAAEDVAPFTQLTWDYGTDYASLKFDEGCRCGAADCITRRPGGGRR